MRALSGEESFRQQNVLRGPPGLLFGLTHLIFAVARLWFGWGPDLAAEEEPLNAVAEVTAVAEPLDLELEPNLLVVVPN